MKTTTTIKVANSTDRRKGRQSVEVQALWKERGLAVTRTHNAPGWAITHIASGYAVRQRIPNHRHAVAVAKRLLDAGDWTRNRSAIVTDRQLKDKVFTIMTESRLLGLLP